MLYIGKINFLVTVMGRRDVPSIRTLTFFTLADNLGYTRRGRALQRFRNIKPLSVILKADFPRPAGGIPNFPQISLGLVSQSVKFVIPPPTRGLVVLVVSGGVLFVWFVGVCMCESKGSFVSQGDRLIEDKS